MTGAACLGAVALDDLTIACLIVSRAYGATPFLVGSALERPTYRDVDVRLILPDLRFEQLFGDEQTHGMNPFWVLTCRTTSAYLAQHTGLPVDFQIQQFTAANKRYPDKRRHPLGCFHAVERYPFFPENRHG